MTEGDTLASGAGTPRDSGRVCDVSLPVSSVGVLCGQGCVSGAGRGPPSPLPCGKQGPQMLRSLVEHAPQSRSSKGFPLIPRGAFLSLTTVGPGLRHSGDRDCSPRPQQLLGAGLPFASAGAEVVSCIMWRKASERSPIKARPCPCSRPCPEGDSCTCSDQTSVWPVSRVSKSVPGGGPFCPRRWGHL